MPFLRLVTSLTKPLGCRATRRRKPAAAQRTAGLSMDQTSPKVRDACSIRCASATPFPTGSQRCVYVHSRSSNVLLHITSSSRLTPTALPNFSPQSSFNRHHHFRRCGCCSCRSCQCYIHHRRSNQHSLPLLVSPSHLRQHYQSHRLRLLHHRSWCTTTTAPLLSPSSSLPLPLSLNHCHLRHCRHRFRHQQN